MYSPEKVQQATNEIVFALKKRQLSESSINRYKRHYQELNTYIKNKELTDIDENTLLEFLRFQYDVHIPNLHAKGFDRIAGGHIRPLAILNWYLVTGEIDSRARMRTPPFMCPEGFSNSYGLFMDHLQQKGLAYSTIHNYRETAQQLIRHMTAIGIESADVISSAEIMSFLSLFEHFSANSFGALVGGVKQYLSFLFSEGFLDEDFSTILPQLRRPRYAGIPHIWSKEDLKAILSAVDRASPTMKPGTLSRRPWRPGSCP